MTTRPVSVVLADDDSQLREDLAVLLGLEDDIEVVGQAGDGHRASELCRTLRPDVAVLDIRMPVMNGIEATRAIRQDGGRTRVLVLTTFDLDEYVLGAVRAGAAGFLVKDRAVADLASAVRTVASGEGVVSPRATARLLREFTTAPGDGRAVPDLTEREVQLVRLLARGLSNEEIAAAAGITRATVKTHVSSVIAKLGVASRLQVVVWAYDNGVAAPPPR